MCGMKRATLLLPLLAVAATGAFGQNSDCQKAKDCAAQAEKVKASKDGVLGDYEKSVRELVASLNAARSLQGFVETARTGKKADSTPITLIKGYVNHYSPKYSMCFVEAVFDLQNVHSDDKLDRTTSKLLINAFEGGLLADLDFTT
jgi:hypothetical protein